MPDYSLACPGDSSKINGSCRTTGKERSHPRSRALEPCWPQSPRGLPMAKAVLVVDDNAFIRQALCELFKHEADFEVCGEAENGREAIEKAQQLHPVRAGGAALSPAWEGAAAGGSGAHAADLLFAAVVQPVGPGGGRGAVRLGGDAAVRGH